MSLLLTLNLQVAPEPMDENSKWSAMGEEEDDKEDDADTNGKSAPRDAKSRTAAFSPRSAQLPEGVPASSARERWSRLSQMTPHDLSELMDNEMTDDDGEFENHSHESNSADNSHVKKAERK
eukprot:6171980-Pleurochrysis_carterae.AAC.1